jgi:hypothetical protein
MLPTWPHATRLSRVKKTKSRILLLSSPTPQPSLIKVPRAENISVRRNFKPALLAATVMLIVALALLLAFLIRGAETIVGTMRYTSICTHCGVQTAADFYYLFDSELAQAQQILPMSRRTLMPEQNPDACTHEYVLVGKTVFALARNGAFTRQVRGQPSGDPEFEKAEVKNTFLALSQKNPEAATAFIEALAKKRYRGVDIGTMPVK